VSDYQLITAKATECWLRIQEKLRYLYIRLFHLKKFSFIEGSLPDLILHNKLFDSSFYLSQKPGVKGTPGKLLQHYLLKGFVSGLDPHPLFSSSYYLAKNPEIEISGINPLVHYLESELHHKKNPHPLFDISYYLDQNPDVAESGLDPLLHYLEFGCQENRSPHPLFCPFAYLYKHKQLIGPQVNPLIHFVLHGQQDIHPLFNGSYYLQQNPGAIDSGMNPMVHFLQYGFKQEQDLYLYKKREIRTEVKIILIFDNVVPRFDRDSGSLRLFNMITILVESGFKVILWAEAEPGDESYIEALEALDVKLPYKEDGIADYLFNCGDTIDLVILHRLTIADQYLEYALALLHAKLVIDTVDLSFLREEREARLKGVQVNNTMKMQELHYARCVDQIFVVSPVEKEILKKEGLKEKISVVTNIHSEEMMNTPFEQREGLLFIGGFKHIPNIDGIRWFVRSIFPLLMKQNRNMHLTIVGSYPPDEIRSLACDTITVTGYVEDVAPYFEKARVFVSPLRYGAGVKGKIGQSMAFGLPVVTTSIGAEGMHLTDGHSAMIVDEEESFAREVLHVYSDPRLWDKLSSEARKIIERHYTPVVVKEALLEAIRG